MHLLNKNIVLLPDLPLPEQIQSISVNPLISASVHTGMWCLRAIFYTDKIR